MARRTRGKVDQQVIQALEAELERATLDWMRVNCDVFSPLKAQIDEIWNDLQAARKLS